MTPTTKFLVLLAGFVAALSLEGKALSSQPDPEKFRPDNEKLGVLNQLTAPWDAVDRWRMEYDATPLAPSVGRVEVHRIMAVSGSDLYSMTAHAPPPQPWQDDPFSQELIIHNDRAIHRWVFNRAYTEISIQPGNHLPGSTWMDLLFAVVPRWPLTRYEVPHDPSVNAPVVLIQALRSPDYRLVDGLETVNGEECLV